MIAAFEQRHGLTIVPGLGHDRDVAGRLDRARFRTTSPEADDETRCDYQAMAGIPLPFVEIRARVGDEDVPWDGEAMGELEVRGPWVAASYYDAPEQADRWTTDGWFKTGDIVSIHPRGYIQIKDRSKDVIKSGGEWISSVELENALMAHPAVAEAAVIAIPDEKWAERPLAAVVLKDGRSGDARRAARVPRAELREVVAARAVRVRRRDPEDERRQVPQDGAARAVRAQRARRPGRLESRAAARTVDGPFELRDVARPRRRDGEVLVRVRAAGINFADVLIRRGRYPQMPELPAVLGAELAGELEDGTRVMAITSGAGGYAELAAVDRAQLVPLPDARDIRRGRVVPAHVPDRVRPADAAGAAASRVRRCSCTRRRAASARRRSRSRARSARGWSQRSARRRSSTLCRELGADEAYVYDELPDDLRGRRRRRSGRRRAVRAQPIARLNPLGQLVAIGSAAGLWPETAAGAPRRPERRRAGRSTSAGCCATRPTSSARAAASCSSSGSTRRVQAARRRRVPARRGRATRTSSSSRAAASARSCSSREGADHRRPRRARRGDRGGARRRRGHRPRPAGVRRRRSRRVAVARRASSTRRSSTRAPARVAPTPPS